MRTYEFRIVLAGAPELTPELGDRLYEAGCDDSTPGSCEGVTFVDFDREAASLEDAMRTAVANVRAAGCEVAKVEVDANDLVSA